MKRIWIFILIYSILIGGSALIADLVDEQDGENLAGIPSSIKVSPQRKGYYEPYGLFYNPNIDMYVVFMLEYHLNHVILYSRLFNRKGRPASGFQTIAELHESDIGIVDVAYNQQDDVFFMVWEGRNYDEIKGILCDGEGWPIIPVDEAILIKKASGNDTGFWPQVTWIPATNQYAVNWMLINWRKPEDFRNGQFLSVLNSDLTFRVRKRKVRAQTMKNYLHFARILPLEDKLLWTAAQDGMGPNIQPVVWFTNFKGKILTQYGNEGDGFIYPHPAVGGRGIVRAAHNDVEDTIFLYWGNSNSPWSDEQAYREQRFRLMASNGEFKGPWMIAPRKYPYQCSSTVNYNPVENRFFWIAEEYKTIHSTNPYRSYIRGKLWGCYVGNEGDFEMKNGKQRWRPVSLTRNFSDTNTSMGYAGCTYNGSTNEYFILYMLYDFRSYDQEIWGVLYK